MEKQHWGYEDFMSLWTTYTSLDLHIVSAYNHILIFHKIWMKAPTIKLESIRPVASKLIQFVHGHDGPNKHLFASFTNAPKSVSHWSAVKMLSTAHWTLISRSCDWHYIMMLSVKFSHKYCSSYANNSFSIDGDCLGGYSFSYLWV